MLLIAIPICHFIYVLQFTAFQTELQFNINKMTLKFFDLRKFYVKDDGGIVFLLKFPHVASGSNAKKTKVTINHYRFLCVL